MATAVPVLDAFANEVTPPPPAPLDLGLAVVAACSEVEVEESDPLFFTGQGQSRLAKQARVICAVVRCRESASSSPSATPKRPNTGYAAGPPGATAASALGDLASRALALSKNLSQ
jgi:hypothetical protein